MRNLPSFRACGASVSSAQAPLRIRKVVWTEWRSYSDQVARQLEQKGLVRTENLQAAELAVFMAMPPSEARAPERPRDGGGPPDAAAEAERRWAEAK
jgi:hypothetical protein